MQRSEQINELAAALCKAQGMIEGAKKDSVNPHFKSAYADLASVWEAVRGPLTSNGLAVTQWLRTTENGVEVETVLMHTSGQYMADVLWLPLLKLDAQAVGSASSYGRRYALMAALGVAPIDDDGEAAVSHKPGVPGMASGGTDFRPAGPRRMPPGQSSANGRRMANDDAHLVDDEREKGALQIPVSGNGNAVKRAEWVKKAIEVFKAAQSKDELTQWWKAETDRLQIIEDAMPAEYERLIAAYDSAIERTARA